MTTGTSSILAEDVIFDFVISVPAYPRRVEGRRAVAELYRGCGSSTVLRSADELAVHRDRETSVIALEYAVHGRQSKPGGGRHLGPGGRIPLLEGVTGRYFEDCNEAELNTYADSGVRPYALHADNAQRLWDLGTAMLRA